MEYPATPFKTDSISTYALEQARYFVILTAEDYKIVDAHCAGLLELKKRIVADFKEPKARAKAAHQAICDQESGHLAQLDEARRIEIEKLGAWKEQQRARDEAVRLEAQAMAKKQAEELAVDIASSVEKKGGDGTRILDKMMKAPPAVHIESSVPKSQTRTRDLWEIDSIDESKLPDEYWIPDRQAIAAVVRAKKVENPIPGVVAKARTI